MRCAGSCCWAGCGALRRAAAKGAAAAHACCHLLTSRCSGLCRMHCARWQLSKGWLCAAAHQPPCAPGLPAVQVEADINRREAQLFTNWLEEARRHAAEEAAARAAAEEEEKLVGPAAPLNVGGDAFQADYGTHLLPGEGQAMAAYVQVGRGRAGWGLGPRFEECSAAVLQAERACGCCPAAEGAPPGACLWPRLGLPGECTRATPCCCSGTSCARGRCAASQPAHTRLHGPARNSLSLSSLTPTREHPSVLPQPLPLLCRRASVSLAVVRWGSTRSRLRSLRTSDT